jgi:hypothetical protein
MLNGECSIEFLRLNGASQAKFNSSNAAGYIITLLNAKNATDRKEAQRKGRVPSALLCETQRSLRLKKIVLSCIATIIACCVTHFC